MKRLLISMALIASAAILLVAIAQLSPAQTNVNSIKLRGWTFLRSVTLTWGEQTNGTNVVTGFIVERGGSDSNNFVTLTTLTNFVLSYTYNAPVGPYCYRVFAYNDAGTSPPSNVACTP